MASMPSCSANNTLMTGIPSVVAMVATDVDVVQLTWTVVVVLCLVKGELN